MSTDVYQQVLYNDGEGLVHTDLNNSQRYLRALINDGIIQYIIGASKLSIDATNNIFDPEIGGENGTDTETRFAFAINPGAAYLRKGSGNNKVAIAPGMLLQKVGTTDGSEATLLPYVFTGSEEFTLTAGDATNPRVDLLQMKLEYIDTGSTSRDFEDATTRVITSTSQNISKRVQCTLSVKAGTPAATPTVPDPDSGYVAVGSVMIGANYATGTAVIMGEDTAGANAVVHDQRLPVRVRAYRVDPIDFKLVTAWALSNNNSTVTSSNATNDLYIPCPAPLGRLVGVQIHSTVAFVGGNNRLGRSNGILTTSFVNRNFPAFNTFSPAVFTPFNIFDGASRVNAGADLNASATNKIGAPLWTNGRRCVNETQKLAAGIASAPLDTLVLRIQSGVNAHVLGACTFFVAEGL